MKDHQKNRKEIIGFIGTGRAGSALARLFNDHGFRIDFVMDRDFDKAARCQIICGARTAYQNLKNIDTDCSILFVTVPDDMIGGVVQELESCDIIKSGRVIVHTSGVLSSDVLSSLRKGDVPICSFHPCTSFTDVFTGTLDDASIAIEGDPDGCNRLEKLARAIGAKPFFIDKKHKILYHAGCTIASNYFVALMESVQKMMDRACSPNGFQVVLPLIRTTLQNMTEGGIGRALTGPIVRGDAGTIKKHLTAIEEHFPALIRSYVVLGLQTLTLARQSNLE